MKFSSAVLAALFFWNVMGVPSQGILEKSPALRCCCGSTICRCAPGQKKFCPLQKNVPAVEQSKTHPTKTESLKRCHFSSNQSEVISEKPLAPVVKKSCHFSKSEKLNSKTSKIPSDVAVLEETVSVPHKLILSPSGCGTNGDRAALPSSAKDFYWLVPEVATAPAFYQEYFLFEKFIKVDAWQSGIDHPPRLTSLPAAISR